jgi:hypothetical protein
MRKVLSIPLIVLILFTGISIKFATHYCSGSVFATKVSLSGELATCGMEHHVDYNSHQENITKHCCEDVLSAYAIDNNYFGSSFHLDNPGMQGIHLFIVPLDINIDEIAVLNPVIRNIRPPGMNDFHSPTIQALCVFLI